MANIIRSGATTDEMTIDPISKAARVTLYKADGTVWNRKVEGLFYAVSPVIASVAAADNGTTAARLGWLQMPVGNARRGRLREASATLVLGAAVAADLTVMFSTIAIQRFTFTGAFSGALITPSDRILADANNADLRTVNTGATVTLSQGIAKRLNLTPFVDFATAVATFSVTPVISTVYAPNEDDEMLDFGPGEGIVFYQPDAGNTSWRTVVNLVWDEYTP